MVFQIMTPADVVEHMTMRGQTGPDTTDQGVIDLVDAVSGAVAYYLKRDLETTARTVTMDVRRNQRALFLPAFPIDTGEAFTLKESTRRDFTEADATWDSDDYAINANTGVVTLDRGLLGGAQTVQVTWTGGMGADAAAIKAAFPEVTQGAVSWAAFVLRKSESTGVKSSGAKASRIEWDRLTPEPPAMVRTFLDPHRVPRFRAA